MNEIMNQIASAGDLAAASPDSRIFLSMYVFTFIIIVTCSIIIVIKNLGGGK